MKSIKNIKLLMIVGLLPQAGMSFARNDQAEDAQRILNRIKSEPRDDHWEPTGPTVEDIRAATKAENQAAKGSREDKLISAVKKGDLKNVKTFISSGADLEARDNENMTALMRAAEKGYADIVRILLDAGADISAKDRFGCTAFFKAADKNHVDVVKIFIAKGVAVDSNFEGIFVSSVFKGNTEMVKALMVESARIKDDILTTAHMMTRNPELLNLIKGALNKKSQ